MPLGGNILSVTGEEAITWLQSDMARPSVLITDWQNAKPIMEQLQDKPNCAPPRLTVVLCALRKSFSKAEKWTQTLPPDVGQVYACVAERIPWSLLGEVIQRCFNTVVCDMNASDVRPLKLDSEVPEADLEEEPHLEEADGDRDAHLPLLKECVDVPLSPLNLPAPATLVRRPGGVLVEVPLFPPKLLAPAMLVRGTGGILTMRV